MCIIKIFNHLLSVSIIVLLLQLHVNPINFLSLFFSLPLFTFSSSFINSDHRQSSSKTSNLIRHVQESLVAF
ncbi:unnamed protein product [Lactuca virosa]|uniref:Uncharacterized protein n=1 Tax=Lactuca virosa TaxID=75947 RepID=A0AAU9N9E6_9ASTR|nr:unnamed protein product [Lactuca virosa]